MRIKLISYLSIFIMISLFSCTYAPETPEEISGPSQGKVKEMLVFTVSTEDPQKDDISYQFDWGNGDKSTWTEFMDNDVPVIKSYVYYEEGTYKIRVRAMDEKGYKSRFSKSHTVTIK